MEIGEARYHAAGDVDSQLGSCRLDRAEDNP